MLQKEPSLCLPIGLDMLFDFSYADHSGHIIEIDQIQNTAWASASSVF